MASQSFSSSPHPCLSKSACSCVHPETWTWGWGGGRGGAGSEGGRGIPRTSAPYTGTTRGKVREGCAAQFEQRDRILSRINKQ